MKSILYMVFFMLTLGTGVTFTPELTFSKTWESDSFQQGEQRANGKQEENEHIIIWYHNVHRDDPIALKTALSSGLITHAMIKCNHRLDFDYDGKSYVSEAIEIVKRASLQIIWSRTLWPLVSIEKSRADDLFDLRYYIQEIVSLRDEAVKIGADCVAIDAEAYGYSPVKKYLKGKNRLSKKQRGQLKRVIEEAVALVGRVNFVYPGGSKRKKHPANILSNLGDYRISEDTYYAVESRLNAVDYPYEIFGAYVNTHRKNEARPHLPYFLVNEIFQKKGLWLNKKGLFLYPKERNALAVAKELVNYSKKRQY